MAADGAGLRRGEGRPSAGVCAVRREVARGASNWVHRSALEAAAKQAGCTIERDGALFVVRDDWTENEDHAAWLVASKVGVPLESVTVGLRAERSGANGVTPARDGDDFTRSSLHRNSRPGGALPQEARRAAHHGPCRSACLVSRRFRRSSRAGAAPAQHARSRFHNGGVCLAHRHRRIADRV
jgi:hypothetical protein